MPCQCVACALAGQPAPFVMVERGSAVSRLCAATASLDVIQFVYRALPLHYIRGNLGARWWAYSAKPEGQIGKGKGRSAQGSQAMAIETGEMQWRGSTTRRGLLTLGGIAMGGLLLAACNPLATRREEPADQSISTPHTLEWAFWGSDAHEATARQTIEKFRERYPGVTLVARRIEDPYAMRLASAVASGKAPDVQWVDLAQYPVNVLLRQYLDVTVPLNKSKTIPPEAFYPRPLNVFHFRDRWSAVPVDLDADVMYVNRSLLERTGLAAPVDDDWTWDDYLRLCQGLAEASLPHDAAPTTRPEWTIPLWASGADILDDESQPRVSVIASPVAVQALQWTVDLGTRYGLVAQPEFMAPYGGALGYFAAGKLAFWPAAAEMARAVADRVPADRWGVLPMPKGERRRATSHCATGLAIWAGTPAPDAAWRAVEFLAGPVGAGAMARTGLVTPVLKDVAQDIDFMLSRTLSPEENLAFVNAMSYARRVTLSPLWARIMLVLNTRLAPVWSGTVPPKDAAMACKLEIDPLLAMGSQ